IPRYGRYGLLLFAWYLLLHVCEELQPVLRGLQLRIVMSWASILFVMPFLQAGILGGINRRGAGDVVTFLKDSCAHYLRFLGVELCLMVLVLAGLAMAPLVLGHAVPPESRWLRCLFVPVSAVRVFWVSAIVVERGRMGRCLVRSVKTMASWPFALAVGLAWGALSCADSIVFEDVGKKYAVTLAGVRAGVFAFAAVWTYSCAIGIYRKARVQIFGEAPEELASIAPSPAPGESCANAGFALSFLALLPVFNVAALVLGIIAVRQSKRFTAKSAVACCVGGFSTAVYLLVLVGYSLSPQPPPESPGYQFLAETEARLKPCVVHLERGDFTEAEKSLRANKWEKSERSWAFLCASAIVSVELGKADEAQSAFRQARDRKPDRGEFYFYYGRLQLRSGDTAAAIENLLQAARHEPPVREARRYVELALNAYTPSPTAKTVGIVVILLFALTLHEYAHAYAAWKLGDSTARDQGRLSLNPVRHLDLLGSLILPGALIWSGSPVVFGWGRPVPMESKYFADPRKGRMIVGVAGPAANLLICMVCFYLLALLVLMMRIMSPGVQALNLAAPALDISLVGIGGARSLAIVLTFLKQLFYSSLVLGFFNLIPVPPLDGSWILSGFLPERAGALFEKSRPYAFFIFLALVLTRALDILLVVPLGLAWGLMHASFVAMGFGG
ncbi:MAG: site-2 protease family protein, partial [Planctomycetota bacterium]|nr:site-2 protease family protein [Planctomycetota bacterium]